ncbi:MAG: response regulator transcription factor [Propionibacteriaceae bacterium]|jgi:DNA-binding response OmpR family regulator|nr:response regulator transcription factor [Propionibacteriaceae bacterium]
MRHTVLICDDDEDIRAAIQIYLSQEGYEVVCASDGAEAVAMVDRQPIHLILLDVMMPVMDGITAAVRIRHITNAPILFLSAKAEDADRILGLTIGGDDYITKPFKPAELMARVKAALRRYARLGGVDGPPQQFELQGVYATGGLTLDDTLKRVELDGEEVTLTALEYNILHLLMSNMDRIFSSAQVYEAVWGVPAFDVAKTVSVHMRHIRQKIEIDPKQPQYLKVVYGLGYKVVKQS